MKKIYVKPEVYFESFELGANIATGCSVAINHAEGSAQCSMIPGIGTIFTNNSCEWIASDDENVGAKFCYHVPMEAKRLFPS